MVDNLQEFYNWTGGTDTDILVEIVKNGDLGGKGIVDLVDAMSGGDNLRETIFF